jgi:tellurite resistance protein TerC
MISQVFAASSNTAADTGIHVPGWVWAVSLVVVFAVYTADFIVAARNPHVVAMKEAGIWVGVYAVAALVFGAVMWLWHGATFGAAFLAGWVTEYSLSVDNLFVFVIILTSFAVPVLYQQEVLQIGIIGALILRFVFILIGAAALERFSWLFYIFGAFLIYSSIRLAIKHNEEKESSENKMLTLLEKRLPLTTDYHEGKFWLRLEGRRVFTPLFIVMIAIFTTDLLFALDSIPAIFGLTQEPYIVFMANAFALMGLRQMYFLLNGLLDRLIYLTYGLAVILGFIGIKLLLHAAHESGLDVPEIGTFLSLAVIILTLVVTVGASLYAVKKDPSKIKKPAAQEGLALGHLQQEHPHDDAAGA